MTDVTEARPAKDGSSDRADYGSLLRKPSERYPSPRPMEIGDTIIAQNFIFANQGGLVGSPETGLSSVAVSSCPSSLTELERDHLCKISCAACLYGTLYLRSPQDEAPKRRGTKTAKLFRMMLLTAYAKLPKNNTK